MVGAGLVSRYDGLLVVVWRMQPFSRVRTALVLALTERHEVLEVVDRSLVNDSISNCVQATVKAGCIAGTSAESELAGRRAGKTGMNAHVSGVLEAEAPCEALNYHELEGQSLPHAQL